VDNLAILSQSFINIAKVSGYIALDIYANVRYTLVEVAKSKLTQRKARLERQVLISAQLSTHWS